MQELLVGLVISSIIIGMMYTIYVQINKQLIGHNLNQQELMEFNQFRQVLSKDVLFARNIEQSNQKEFKLLFADNSFTYRITEKLIVRDRNNGVKDTFKLEVTKIEVISEKEEEENNLNQALRLNARLMGEEIVLFENKKISKAKKINELYLNEY